MYMPNPQVGYPDGSSRGPSRLTSRNNSSGTAGPGMPMPGPPPSMPLPNTPRAEEYELTSGGSPYRTQGGSSQV